MAGQRHAHLAPLPSASRRGHRTPLQPRQERLHRFRRPSGSRVKVQNNVSVYAGVTLHDDVFVGPSAVFTNDLLPAVQRTMVGHQHHRGQRGVDRRQRHGGVWARNIGPYAMVGAGSVVTRAVAAHALVVGNPARQIGWVCHCGQIFARGSDPNRTRGPAPRAVSSGGPAMTDRPIPIAAVAVDPAAEQLVLEVLRSGHLVQGPMVERFEGRFAEICGVRHAVAVSNGTVSLVAALLALGIGPGDEVVTSPFTFVATINAILEAGATAVLADISLDDYLRRRRRGRGAITPRDGGDHAGAPVWPDGRHDSHRVDRSLARVGHHRRRGAGAMVPVVPAGPPARTESDRSRSTRRRT